MLQGFLGHFDGSFNLKCCVYKTNYKVVFFFCLIKVYKVRRARKGVNLRECHRSCIVTLAIFSL